MIQYSIDKIIFHLINMNNYILQDFPKKSHPKDIEHIDSSPNREYNNNAFITIHKNRNRCYNDGIKKWQLEKIDISLALDKLENNNKALHFILLEHYVNNLSITSISKSLGFSREYINRKKNEALTRLYNILNSPEEK